MWAFRYAGHPQPCPLASYHRLLSSCYFIYSCISFRFFRFLVPSHPFLISFCNFVLISFLIFWLLTLSFSCPWLSSPFLLLLIYPCIPFHLPPSDSSLPVSLLIVCLSLSVTLYILISLLIFCFLTLPFPCLFSCSPYLLLFLVSLLILRLPTPPFHSRFRLFQPGVERLSGEEKNARDCYADSPLIW